MRQEALAWEVKTASHQKYHWVLSAVMAIQNTRVRLVHPDVCSTLQFKTLERKITTMLCWRMILALICGSRDGLHTGKSRALFTRSEASHPMAIH